MKKSLENALISKYFHDSAHYISYIHIDLEAMQEMLNAMEENNKLNSIIILLKQVSEILMTFESFNRRFSEGIYTTMNDEIEKINLIDIVEKVVDIFQVFDGLHKKSSISIHFSYNKNEKIYLIGCKSDMFTVFFQLIDNARFALMEHCTSKPKILINIFELNNTINVEISDNGGGISTENINKVFEEGFTTKGYWHHKGVGLFFCKQVIEKNGGNISIDSQLNFGTKVTLQIPHNNE